MIKNNRQYRSVPSFDEVMKSEQAKPIPSFDEVMGKSVKKKETTVSLPSSMDLSGGAQTAGKQSAPTQSQSQLSAEPKTQLDPSDPVKSILHPLRQQYTNAQQEFEPLRTNEFFHSEATYTLPKEVVEERWRTFDQKQQAEKQSMGQLNTAENEVKRQFNNVKVAKQALETVKKNNGGIIPKDNETAKYATESVNDYNTLQRDIVKNKGIVGAAVQEELRNNPEFAKRYKTLNGKIPDSFKGKLVASYVARQGENIQNFVEDNPQYKGEYEKVTSKFADNFPEAAAAQVGNEVSQEYEKNSKAFADLDTKGFNDKIDQLAAEMYKDNPEKLAIYNKLVKDNKREYFNSAAALNKFGGDIMSGLNSTMNSLRSLTGLRDDKERAFDVLDKEGKMVDANPKGAREWISEGAGFMGMIAQIGATGGVLKGAGAAEIGAQQVPLISRFYDDQLKAAEGRFGSGWKAKLSADLNTAIFSLAPNAIPAAKLKGAFGDAIKSLGDKASVSSVRAKLTGAVGTAIKQYTKGVGEMTAIKKAEQIVDAALGAPHQNADEELYQTFRSMAMGNVAPAALGGVAKFMGTKVEKPNELYEAIKELPEGTYTNALKDAMQREDKGDLDVFLKNIAEQLNSSEIESNTTRSVFGDKISDIALKLYPDARPEGTITEPPRTEEVNTENGSERVGETNNGLQVDNSRGGEGVGDKESVGDDSKRWQKWYENAESNKVFENDLNHELSADLESSGIKNTFKDFEVGKFPSDRPVLLFRGLKEPELNELLGGYDAEKLGKEYSDPMVRLLAFDKKIQGGEFNSKVERKYGASFAGKKEEAVKAANAVRRGYKPNGESYIFGGEGANKYIVTVDARGLDYGVLRKEKFKGEDKIDISEFGIERGINLKPNINRIVKIEKINPDGTLTDVSDQYGRFINDNRKLWMQEQPSNITNTEQPKETIQSNIEEPKPEQVQEQRPTEPPTEPPPPVEPPKETATESGESKGGKDKGVLNHLVESKNISEQTKKGLKEFGLQYEPKSQEEAGKLAKAVVDEMGIEDAVLHAEANKLSDGVNSAVFGEALNRLYEKEQSAKTAEEKLAAAQSFSNISDRFDNWARKAGREISQINNFYKKSPLGVVISENKKRTEAFKEWSKPKEKSWKEAYEEMKKEPEVEKLFQEDVKEALKKERAAERAQRKEKVHKSIDDTLSKWADKLKAKGTDDAQKQGVGVDEIFKAVGATMKKAYDAGEAVAKIVQDAIDYISEKLGRDDWDKEGFRKEWEAKLVDKSNESPRRARIEYLKSELERIQKRKSKEPKKESENKREVPKEEQDLLDEIAKEQKEWDKELEASRQAATDYKKMETERNRQLKRVSELKERLKILQSGKLPEGEKRNPKQDVPEIEALKQEIKETEEIVRKGIAYEKKVRRMEDELQRLKDRREKEKKPSRELTDREQKLKEQIDAERKQWNKEKRDAWLASTAKERVIKKFQKKLKGLSDKEKEEVVRRAFKEIVENGGLEYDDFKKIISDVTGRGEITPEESKRIKELIDKTNSVDDAAKKLREERTEQAYVEYRAAMLESAKATKELNEMLWNKPNIMRRLTSIMQLNTLGLPSLVVNVTYNIWNQMLVRFPVGIVNDAVDRGLAVAAKMVGKDYEREYNVWGTQADFFRGLKLGTSESFEQFLTGLNRQDLFQKEIYGQQIRPFKAIKDLYNYRVGKKKMTRDQVIDKSLQATVGIPAEIVARALNIGDKPQRFAAESAQGAAFAKALGLKDFDKKLFLEFPREEALRYYQNKGLSEEAAAKKADYIKAAIEQEGKRSTFQQDNWVNDKINKVFGGEKSGKGQFIKAITISPFIKIPTNAFWSAYNLINPEIAILQAMVHGGRAYNGRNRGDSFSAMQLREGRYWFAHAIVGVALRAAIIPMVKAGVFNSSNSKDDTKKEREGEQSYEQQGAINITRLAAYLRGDDPNKIEGGLTLQNRWLGQGGVIGNAIANKYEDMTPEQRNAQIDFWDVAWGGLEREGLVDAQNGVFSNASALLQSINSKGSFGFDQYFRNTTGMLANTFHPAMFAQTSRQQLPYVPQYKADSFVKELKNDALTRSSWLRKLTGAYPPSKISIWGEPLKRPDNVMMRLFGLSTTNKDSFAYPLYQDYKKTNDIGFFPPAVMPTLNGKKLNAKQQNVLETYVGQARKSYVAPYINDGALIPGYNKKYSEITDPEVKKSILSYLYGLGRIEGIGKFVSENPEFAPSQEYNMQEEMNKIYHDLFKTIVKYQKH